MMLVGKCDTEQREQLARLRQRIARLKQELSESETLEARIVQEIKPRQERCQRCLGSGRVDLNVNGLRNAMCVQCKGTGIWSEPV